MTTPEPLLRADALARRYGYRRVFQDVSLTVGPGEALAIVGPNGAGKTTLLRVLAGLLRPNRGTVERRATVGLVSHQTMLYDALTARENLVFAARLWGMKDRARIDGLLERVGLARWADERSATFSRGMQQRLALARALLPQPRLLLMDEPLSSLDEAGSEIATGVMREALDRGCGLVLVTHQYDRLAALSTSVGFLVRGTLHGPDPAAQRTPPEVAARYRELLTDA